MAKHFHLTPGQLDLLGFGTHRDPLMPGLAIEVLSSGKKRWRYRRQIPRTRIIATLFGGLYPAVTIASAREWADSLNQQVEAGIDPRQVIRSERARVEMTVAKAHSLYMMAVREGRSSRAKRPNKPRTIKDKLEIYDRDIAPKLAKRNIYEVTEKDLILLVEAKGKTAKIRANRLAAELRVFFGWAASLRGMEVGLDIDPARRLGDLRFPETARSRKLDLVEIRWFLLAIVDEERDFQRGMLLWLLTAARISEVARARRSELVGDVWTIPESRAKNSCAHSIALGPWGRSLMLTKEDWVFPAPRADGPRNNSVWYKARDRVWERMEKLAGHPIERFTPHDFRRTARSNTKRLKTDYETAEAMLNHVKKGLERTYDRYEMEEEKRTWFHTWEREVARIAAEANVAGALGVPDYDAGIRPDHYVVSFSLPERPGIQPSVDVGPLKARTMPVLAVTRAKIVFAGEAWRPPLTKPIDLPPG